MSVLITPGGATDEVGWTIPYFGAFTDISVAAWGHLTQLPSTRTIISKIAIQQQASGGFVSAFIFQITTANFLFFRPATGAATNDVTGVTAVTASTPQHYGASFSDVNNRSRVYLNGVQDAVNTTATLAMSDPGAGVPVSVGHRIPFNAEVFDGRMSEVAVWTIELEADDFAMLAAGVPPIHVRPDALAFTLQLLNNVDPQPDLSINQRDGTRVIQGTGAMATDDHPSQVGWAMGDTAYMIREAARSLVRGERRPRRALLVR